MNIHYWKNSKSYKLLWTEAGVMHSRCHAVLEYACNRQNDDLMATRHRNRHSNIGLSSLFFWTDSLQYQHADNRQLPKYYLRLVKIWRTAIQEAKRRQTGINQMVEEGRQTPVMEIWKMKLY